MAYSRCADTVCECVCEFVCLGGVCETEFLSVYMLLDAVFNFLRPLDRASKKTKTTTMETLFLSVLLSSFDEVYYSALCPRMICAVTY